MLGILLSASSGSEPAGADADLPVRAGGGRAHGPGVDFFREHEQYQRHRPITFAYESLKEMGRDVRLIVYPGVGRGFDFRPPHVRTFADDLAAKDAMQRSLYPATSASPLAAPCQAAVSDTKSGARGDRVTSTYTLGRRV